MFLRLANRRVSHDDLTVQIAVTVGTAYLSFYVAQYVLGKKEEQCYILFATCQFILLFYVLMFIASIII